MDNQIDFDALSRKATQTNATEDLNGLFGAVFALPEWNFVARGELPNVYPYVASNAAAADNQPMVRAFTDADRLRRFARENSLTKPDGSCDILTIPTAGIVEYLEDFIQYGAFGVWFNSDTESDGFLVPIKQLQPIKNYLVRSNAPPPTAEARQKQDNLANFGMSQTPDGGFDLNLSINKIGVVNFDVSIAPFYEAIVPLLKDFQGTGEYVTLLRFEPDGKSEQVENIAENAHGAYFQIRRFHYLNPKNNVRIGVNSIHSNRLRHIQSNAELIVSIELCKTLADQTAVLYHRFEGPKADVLNLAAAIQPLLENCGYESVK